MYTVSRIGPRYSMLPAQPWDRQGERGQFGAWPKRPSPARIYEVLPLVCPACCSEMRIVAFLTDPPFVQAILLRLGLSERGTAATR